MFAGLRPHEFVSEQRTGGWVHLDWQAISQTNITKEKRLTNMRASTSASLAPAALASVTRIGHRSDSIQIPRSGRQCRRNRRTHPPTGNGGTSSTTAAIKNNH